MRNALLPRLAVRGLYNNRRLYFPFVLTAAFMALVYFTLSAFVWDSSFGQNIPNGKNIQLLLSIGYFLLPVVLVPFLIYINSFLLKARSRELALYAILGLQKRHIAVILLIENIICLTACLLLGLTAGATLCPALFNSLLTVLGLHVDFTWRLSLPPMLATGKLFGFAFAVLLIANVWRAARTQPASLLREQTRGEKPLRAKPLLTLLGAACLAGGYGLSLRMNMQTFTLNGFMLALLLVITGTYGLFTAVSSQILGRMRRNPRFYADPSRFVVVSGLQYRMRKNAAGLVNLCLFGSAALFTLCCSLCVLFGQDDAISKLGQALTKGQIGLNTANLVTSELIMEFTTLSVLGIFFVVIFLACTALVLYYKQLLEGIEDAGRFRILRAVGLSDELTRRTARRQLRTVFLLPLGTALVHITFASPILAVFMQALAISDTRVLASGILLSMLCFCAVYAVCYRLTSRVYLRLIA